MQSATSKTEEQLTQSTFLSRWRSWASPTTARRWRRRRVNVRTSRPSGAARARGWRIWAFRRRSCFVSSRSCLRARATNRCWPTSSSCNSCRRTRRCTLPCRRCPTRTRRTTTRESASARDALPRRSAVMPPGAGLCRWRPSAAALLVGARPCAGVAWPPVADRRPLLVGH